MKKTTLLLLLLAASLLLAGCGSQQPEESFGVPQQDPMSVRPPTAVPASDPFEDYDPASEEDNGSFMPGAVYDDYGQTVYAGSTPIPLDPIDMPTPTPRPSLTFDYSPVVVDNLKLSFDAPAGWLLDTSAPDMVVLTDPIMRDNINATMTIQITPVSDGYTLSNVKDELRKTLRDLGQYNYSTWEPTSLSSRTLLDKDGYYANYRGVYTDGTIIRGRVMIALLDNNRIITLHMAVPGWYNESYMKVVDQFRHSVKQVP